MFNNEHFNVARYWAKSDDVFPSVDIKGGVAVTWYDKNENFGAIGTFITFDELRSILQKVRHAKNFESFSELVYPRDLYRLTDKLYEENPWAEIDRVRVTNMI